MSQQIDPTLLATDEVAQRCAQETERFFHGKSCDTRFGFELFRRAFVERNEYAWEKIYAQYLPLVSGWVRQHTLFALSDEETQYFANRAFERIWRALTPNKFKRFTHLKALLRYLQMCAYSVIIDDARRSRHVLENTPDGSYLFDQEPPRPTLENQVLEDLQHRALWRIIDARLQDDKERHALYGCFVLNLKPRELCVRFQDVFNDVNEVYRVKQNVLARLRRDPELIDLFSAQT